MHTFSVFLPNEVATLALGARCAALLCAPATVYLQGNLGAGKTTFVRGLLRGLGHQGAVKSPTYALVESYRLPESNQTIHHFDLYRFHSPEEWEDTGLVELFQEQALCLIEWSEQGGNCVPRADWLIELVRENDGRRCTITLANPNTKLQQAFSQWQN
ncbi:MAG: tRNA (adenosine(37)-N6)-threonylcarbamoyltransferase complex ATPase subunit type 1 TsaE [Alysiella sp.]|uniref:tRNA (adenosine(37)-N6)-threonylcarbamoyltransferase complex ATPase subunit type 1 TsaE n=1 Tax=Alysiella sp. TaxID=1872483 RepID=UPI0026DB0D20|nr:tRNA (adenosine(37)-N6)-threonylcarbamoyltransferase complex ATPase subunit type 1 TsaE [Alysiella sp.]MDO4434514.1 tRNA (adenosine(37)-N6)-threonylcarbamoyltransferase complex ATPase subunit type 1 TsaE [Alysiella sp.]